ncbi:hypothetical protein A0H81_13675 [Grifola frondosa]|uniref:Transmembrane protein 188 n=1 Tax=Grifola frondosa TaxID=5627 RepID=A0A1C7LNL2_GRIFR|nr:hypothetical protein A0H81_13675 [Grifola frondosa]
MPPRLSPAPPKGAFYPVNDAATYRDLLLFEERLKTNAASLNRRKHRYQLFLAQLLLLIAFLLADVVLHANLLGVPCTFVLRRLLPRTYTGTAEVKVHPYVASGLLFVAVTTLVLFFASGLYAEKIGYANRHVPPPSLPNHPLPAPLTYPTRTSPRGELIFSSRVDRAFREAYERYRAAFERRRERREARRRRTPGPAGSVLE